MCFVNLTERLRLLPSQRQRTHSLLNLLTLFLPAVSGSITPCAYFSLVHQVVHRMVHMLLLPLAVEHSLMTHTDYQNMDEEQLFLSHVTAALDWSFDLLPSSCLVSVPPPVSVSCQQWTTRPILAPSVLLWFHACVCVFQTGRSPHWPCCWGEQHSPSSPFSWRSSRSASAAGVAATSP